jgi:hypothetical protein
MDIQSWEAQVAHALKSARLEYRPIYSSIALISPRPPEAKGLGADMMIAMERELWRRACARQTFGDPNRVTQRFGRSLQENYGVGNGPFLDVANAYWTFKLEMQDILPNYYDTWLGQALIAVEFRIAQLFFPTPGPISMPKRLRKKAQREYLQEAAPNFAIEQYLKENPMLKGWFG